MHYARNLDHE
jgi:hypothetical protein